MARSSVFCCSNQEYNFMHQVSSVAFLFVNETTGMTTTSNDDEDENDDADEEQEEEEEYEEMWIRKVCAREGI